VPELEFRILGRLCVTVDGVAQPIGGPKQRAMLAALLLTPNRAVPIERLTGLLWDQPPRSATANLRTYATGLRKITGSRLAALAGGYELDVRAGESDLECFTESVRAARVRHGAGDLESARRHFLDALALWTGRSGHDLSSDSPVHRLVQNLNESRMLAVEDSTAIRLDLGEEKALVPELRAELSDHRTRERLWTQLMVALYRCGDVAGSLYAYHEAAAALDAELGMQPGEELRTLQRAILERDPALDRLVHPAAVVATARSGRTAPNQLPIDARVLVGRQREVKQIVAVCEEPDNDSVPTIVAIDGPGGIGKSAIALHVAHLMSSAHPDGQLYLDLHGACAGLEPSPPAQALGALLRALDSSAAPTGDVAEDGARFRTLAAGRRLLIVLDNAIDSDQVIPLLPSKPGCTVLITSRRRLSTVDAALHLHLDVLSDEDGVELLTRVGGVHGEPEAAATIARMCGGLPLALRVAAARLTKRSDWTAADLAQRLGDDRRRLDELGVDDLGVRACFAVTYDALAASDGLVDAHASMIYRLMGVLQVPNYDANLLAALADVTYPEVDAALQRLVDLQLVTASGGCYRMHDLMRLFAQERAELEIPPDTRLAALQRAFWYLADAARTASIRLRPAPWEIELGPDPRRHTVLLQCGSRRAAQSWFTTWRATLFAAIRQAAATGEAPRPAMAIVEALSSDLERRGCWHDIADLNNRMIDLARSIGDLHGEAHALRVIATIHQRLKRPVEAMRHIRRSIQLYRRLGDARGLAIGLNAKGIFLTEASRLDSAEACLTEALQLIEPCGAPTWTGVILNALGMHHRERGNFDQAIGYLERALTMRRDCGDALGEMYTLMQLARADASLARTDEALDRLERVLELAGDIAADDFELQARRLRFVVLSVAQRRAEADAELAQAAKVCLRVPDELADHKLRELARFVERSNAAAAHAEMFSQRAPA
jgi:DNA-binding SARP family transcriptional activator/tetratricopeptide (TPR) repeat protein